MTPKQETINFFDSLAPDWDTHLIRDDKKISTILNYAGIKKGVTVLDVACGTGALIADYLVREVKSVTAVDISPAMIKIAKSKFADPRVRFINADIETVKLDEQFDCCVVFNAFPHFADSQKLIKILAEKLLPSGRLTIAHDKNREKVNECHRGEANRVSVELIDVKELSALMGIFFDVDTAVSNGEMYAVSGVKR